MNNPRESRPRICDYEGSNYRTEFWEGKGRDYEDRVERIALRRLLPDSGRRLLEVGAGFGRLTNEYRNFGQVVLLDYSLSQLRYAQQHLGASDRYLYVAADAYSLPFRPGSFDGATVIRVIHHISDTGAVFRQIRRVLVPGGTFILEFANKRHLKAMLRYTLRRQDWNPFDLKPVEFVELNYDFHPDYIAQMLEAAQFETQQRIPVSFFRLASLKNRLPTNLLAMLDGWLQHTGLLVTPSVFTQNVAVGSSPNNLSAPTIFVCPDCGGELAHDGNILVCRSCSRRWAIRDGIYDFKAPLDE
ncbi:MAG: methyltransferase domain-containing protein [Chloroflexi bacterium]|nr:methyltransferase domain-containing protein [Chloroflexota bacterium]